MTLKDREALVWLRMRSCSAGCYKPELHLQHDVSTSLSRRNERRTELTQQLSRLVTALIHAHTRPIKLRAGLLFAPAGVCQLDGRRTASGLLLRLLPCQSGHCMVHLLQLCHVLRCWKDDKYARLGSLPAGTVLFWLWNYGGLFKPRDWTH